ncbi:unnamed protein product, partial [Darwinula stevensoni]
MRLDDHIRHCLLLPFDKGHKTNDSKEQGKVMNGKKVLVIGGGGREHALCWKLAQSPCVDTIFASPGNGGTYITRRTSNVIVNLKSHPVSSPFTPSYTAFFHSVMNLKYCLPNHSLLSFALVVKASGLAGGKGVIVAEEKEGACKAVDDITQEFGDAGRVIIIEECLEGQEVSVMAFSDGKELKMMPGVGDHKRLCDGDKGPNTGGMGAYCPSPFLTPEILRRIHHEILEKTILALQDEGIPF